MKRAALFLCVLVASASCRKTDPERRDEPAEKPPAKSPAAALVDDLLDASMHEGPQNGAARGGGQPSLADLRVTIKTKQYVDESAKDGERIPDSGLTRVLARPFVGDLRMVLVVERGGGLRSIVDESSRKAFASSDDELFARALENVDRDFRDDLVLSPFDAGSPVSKLVDEAAASLLAASVEHWSAVAKKKVRGELLAAVPDATTLLFVGTAEKNARAALRKATQQVFDSASHPVSKTILRFSDKGWQIDTAP